MDNKKILVAVDLELNAAKSLIDQLNPELCRLKVGKGLFTQVGPSIIEQMHKRGFEVFLDLKFHDIPNTVAHAIRSSIDLGVWMVNVHALGGKKMMQAAKEEIEKSTGHKPLLIAVTLLTSFSKEDVLEIGYSKNPQDVVRSLALLAKESGVDGVVCSAQEAKQVHEWCSDDFLTVCPGIRLEDNKVKSDDQSRILTPKEAVKNGADYLVIGRTITQSSNPNQMLIEINQSIC